MEGGGRKTSSNKKPAKNDNPLPGVSGEESVRGMSGDICERPSWAINRGETTAPCGGNARKKHSASEKLSFARCSGEQLKNMVSQKSEETGGVH